MRQVTGGMAHVVRGLDRAMQTMDLERISLVMDKFEGQLEDVDVQTSYMAVSYTHLTLPTICSV